MAKLLEEYCETSTVLYF